MALAEWMSSRISFTSSYLRSPDVALAATRRAIDRDDANSYLPFQGHTTLR